MLHYMAADVQMQQFSDNSKYL